jgi:two-component system OmpR family sensor kinase
MSGIRSADCLMLLKPLRWTKSLRFQLTLWSLATTAVILLIASALCYTLVRVALQRETDQALRGAAASMVHHMAPEDAPEPGEPPEKNDPTAIVRKAHLTSITLPGIGSDALCLRLARADTGETAALSPTLAASPALQSTLAALPARPHGPIFAGSSDDTQLRVLSVQVPQSPYTLQVAVPWDPVEDLLTELLLGLFFAALLFLLLSGIGSGLLVGRALRPINHIVTEAEELTPDRLGSVQLSPRTLSDTEIGHLVAALNRMLARLSQSFTVQRQFTADASHELRTPLTILRGQFELALARDRPAAEYQATLESGLEEVLRMARIVESLAYLTRGDAAGPLGRFLPLSLAALAGEVTATLAGQAAAKNLHLICEAETETQVCGDTDALRRLIQNLVENALTYTPPGGTVTVTVTDNSDHCQLQVTDTGVGIAPADLPHVFDRFFRADPARVNTGGSGLGLSIVQSIAEAHGGEVKVWSEPSEGSSFTVNLPL